MGQLFFIISAQIPWKMDPNSPPLNGPPLTQSLARSKVLYGAIILFKDDINELNPFSIVPLNFFADTDFPWGSIEGEMNEESRAKVRTFSNLTGNYRIFCKIEKGN